MDLSAAQYKRSEWYCAQAKLLGGLQCFVIYGHRDGSINGLLIGREKGDLLHYFVLKYSICICIVHLTRLYVHVFDSFARGCPW